MDGIFRRHWKVRFWHDQDEQNQVKSAIDDVLCDRETELNIKFTTKQINIIINAVMSAARHQTSDYAEK